MDHRNIYERLKLILRLEASKWVKWQVNQRFNTFSKKKKMQNLMCLEHKCKITQMHIINCQQYQHCFKVENYTVDQVKTLLTKQRAGLYGKDLKDYIQTCIRIEKEVTEKVKKVLSKCK